MRILDNVIRTSPILPVTNPVDDPIKTVDLATKMPRTDNQRISKSGMPITERKLTPADTRPITDSSKLKKHNEYEILDACRDGDKARQGSRQPSKVTLNLSINTFLVVGQMCG